MAEYQLYCFGESGNSYKAAITMELAGVDWEAKFVDFFNGGTRTPEYRELNEMGEAPLMVHGGTTLSQSGAIQDYIVAQTGLFGGKDATERREIWRWVLWDNHKLSSVAGMTRFLNNFIPEEKRPQAVIEFMYGRLKGAYATLNNTLSKQEWLVGEQVSVADLSCCGYLYYPEPFGFQREDHPHIDRWLTQISALPGWKAPYDLMPGKQDW